MTNSEIVEPKKRGRPFEKGRSGNPAGKPRGARHSTTLMAEALLEGESEALMEKLVELAQEGNMAALRLVIERLLPARRERPLQFKLPPLESAADAPAAISAIVAGLAEGELTPTEAHALIGAVEAYLKIHGQLEIAQRLAVLEEKIAGIQAQDELRKLTSGESTP